MYYALIYLYQPKLSQNSHPTVVFLTKIYDQCLVYFANFFKGFINWLQDFVSSNSVCLLSYSWLPDFVNRSYDYGPRWITLGPVTIIYV